jgi:hypothetical protein
MTTFIIVMYHKLLFNPYIGSLDSYRILYYVYIYCFVLYCIYYMCCISKTCNKVTYYRVRDLCQFCQTWPAKCGQILPRTDTSLVFCNRKLMRTDILFIEKHLSVLRGFIRVKINQARFDNINDNIYNCNVRGV